MIVRLNNGRPVKGPAGPTSLVCAVCLRCDVPLFEHGNEAGRTTITCGYYCAGMALKGKE